MPKLFFSFFIQYSYIEYTRHTCLKTDEIILDGLRWTTEILFFFSLENSLFHIHKPFSYWSRNNKFHTKKFTSQPQNLSFVTHYIIIDLKHLSLLQQQYYSVIAMAQTFLHILHSTQTTCYFLSFYGHDNIIICNLLTDYSLYVSLVLSQPSKRFYIYSFHRFSFSSSRL